MSLLNNMGWVYMVFFFLSFFFLQYHLATKATIWSSPWQQKPLGNWATIWVCGRVSVTTELSIYNPSVLLSKQISPHIKVVCDTQHGQLGSASASMWPYMTLPASVCTTHLSFSVCEIRCFWQNVLWCMKHVEDDAVRTVHRKWSEPLLADWKYSSDDKVENICF